MKIDKSKLRLGMWYEDEEGNRFKCDDNLVRPTGAVSYHTQWPLEVTENTYLFYKDGHSCRHPRKCVRRTFGWVSGVKGCKCDRCGSTKVGKKFIPFAFMKWEIADGKSYHAFSGTTHVSRAGERTILAMANSGDFTLGEAIITYANACERCMNALAYKYENGADGYSEDSDEYKNCRTRCEFCSEED